MAVPTAKRDEEEVLTDAIPHILDSAAGVLKAVYWLARISLRGVKPLTHVQKRREVARRRLAWREAQRRLRKQL
ncbi:hypothetical protein [Pyrobaculum aerophilum]|uniref:Uncharacterized protein n=1 Tax=Pyrobaculum aerophilum TaxID=13773 RepID=A0A371QZE0_9CREN|nr:hypothetical protein [Pyrobaculum aerophilum]RFA96152.1 hypothetical protein CGL51_05635 [Pyrobaculum aerophilum]RFA96304.1 hypothetical protein CGL52_11020 [Pyrobaculum aerophilum]